MAAILSIWWLYFAKGQGAPRSTQFARKVAGRANRAPDDLWGSALGTGALGLFTTFLLQGVLGRLVTLPQQQLDLDPSKYPVLTLLAWAVMSALVAGVVEETAFRGYIQGGIERSHGLTTAILITGALFGFSHFTHPEVGIVLLPFYLAVAAVYGLLAAATNSVYPSMVLHAGGNMLSMFDLISWAVRNGNSPRPRTRPSGRPARMHGSAQIWLRCWCSVQQRCSRIALCSRQSARKPDG